MSCSVNAFITRSGTEREREREPRVVGTYIVNPVWAHCTTGHLQYRNKYIS